LADKRLKAYITGDKGRSSVDV